MSHREEAVMQVHVHTDHNVVLDAEILARIEDGTREDLARFGELLSRVEAYLTDQSGGKRAGRDLRCVMTAHLPGVPPLVVTEDAESVALAIAGATESLRSSLSSTFDRLEDHRDRATIRGR